MNKLSYLTSLLLLVAGSVIINGCSKSKSSAVTPTRANLVGTYKLSSETSIQDGSSSPVNILDSLPACEKDDELRFNADATYDYLDNGTVCTPTGAYSGTWDLPSSNILVLDGYSLYAIKSFDNKTLVMIFTDLNSSPITTYTLTLVKQ
ncbi:MAG TPA: lipocalin family protein [Puia sp.]|nr:lipocalin family protein [Puia sp.]